MINTTNFTTVALSSSQESVTEPPSPADRVKDITSQMITEYREAEKVPKPCVKQIAAKYEALNNEKKVEKLSERHEKKLYMGMTLTEWSARRG